MTYKKKLIEVALPLSVINRASVRELQNPFLRGHPKGLKWWARLPLAACRAVIWASYVDDPSASPDRFPTEEEQTRERERLFGIFERLMTLDTSAVEDAQAEIMRSSGDGEPPVLIDPFCGGGSIPVEAHRLGLASRSADLNPVAVLIEKVLLEIPSRFADSRPVNSELPDEWIELQTWVGAVGIAEDLRQYARELLSAASERLEEMFPPLLLHDGRGGTSADVIAWLWARAVRCPNPACGTLTPLMKSFNLSTKKSGEWHVEPRVDVREQVVRFRVQPGRSAQPAGTVGRSGFRCLACDTNHDLDYVRGEGRAGRLTSIPLAIVAEGDRSRVYRDFSHSEERQPASNAVSWVPEAEFPNNPRYISPPLYGMGRFADVFTARQLAALGTFTELIRSTAPEVRDQAIIRGWDDDGKRLADGGCLATAYGDAVALLLGETLGRTVMFHNTLCKWNTTNQNVTNPFSLQTLSMSWDYAEANPLNGSLSFVAHADLIADIVETLPTGRGDRESRVVQLDAAQAMPSSEGVVITDPPYYDNVGYADLADFFYVWLRRALYDVDPKLFSTVLSPKTQELVADPTRHSNDGARSFESFREGLEAVFGLIRDVQTDGYPMSIFYAFKQAEDRGGEVGAVSTGWEAMLSGLVGAGLQVVRTWPLQTVRPSRARGQKSNALSSAILLVCRTRPSDAPLATRQDFLRELRQELPIALRELQRLTIPPVDMAQAAIGPGMSVFSRYARVVEADGQAMGVRGALAVINEVLQEVLSEEETEFDGDTRWALTWFEQNGLAAGPYGDAETLSKAKNTSVAGVVQAGIAQQHEGAVRLLRRDELAGGWDVSTDPRLTVWEITQHLILRLNESEASAGDLLRQVGAGLGERAKQLAYLLYEVSTRNGWAEEGVAYNGLIQAWSDIGGFAAVSETPAQKTLGE